MDPGTQAGTSRLSCRWLGRTGSLAIIEAANNRLLVAILAFADGCEGLKYVRRAMNGSNTSNMRITFRDAFFRCWVTV